MATCLADKKKEGVRGRREDCCFVGGRITDATVYLMRHSHASLLHYCGFTVPSAARRLGHSGELHVRTYAHVIEAIGAERWPDLDAMISDARRSVDKVPALVTVG